MEFWFAASNMQKNKGRLISYYWTFITSCLVLTACSAPPVTAAPKKNYSQIKLLSQFTVPRTDFNGITISELSGLAWDQDEQLLYAISDQGRVFHFKLKLEAEQITAVEPVFAANLVDNKGKPIKLRDSEGLFALNASNGKRGDTQLIVSFEHGPRIFRMSPQGRQVGVVALHKDLQNPKNYRSQNSMLESVAYHPKYGFITAPERSLKGEPNNLQTIYSAKQKWSFLAYPAENSAVTGLEILPDKSVLVLERAWVGILHPMVISLRRVDLDACDKAKVCEVQDLGVYSSLIQVDNFEGLTQIRDNLYLMVSDDGQRDLLRTELSLFKVE